MRSPTASSTNCYFQDLADLLHSLDQDDAAYASYFWWKPFYWNSWNGHERGQAFCDLCEKLHVEGEKPKSIASLHEVWTTSAKCGNVMGMKNGLG